VVIIRPPHFFNILPFALQPRPLFSPCSTAITTNRLFGDLDSTNGTQGLLEVAVYGELTGGQGADHEETGTETGVRAAEAELLGDLDQARRRALARSTLCLVDLAGGRLLAEAVLRARNQGHVH